MVDYSELYLLGLWRDHLDPEVYAELVYYNDPDCDLENLEYPCKVCGELDTIDYDLTSFEPNKHYCGKDPRCCP